MAEFSASESEGEVYEVQAILGSRKTGRTTEYLVKWRNFDESHNSWEPQRNLSGAKDILLAYQKALKTPAIPDKSFTKKLSSTKSLGGSTVTKTITTTTTKADLSSPETSPVLRRRTVETTRTVTVGQGSKKPRRGSGNFITRLWASLCQIPGPILVQVICLLIFFGSFIPLK